MASSSSAVKVVLFRAAVVGQGWSSVQEMQHTWRETSLSFILPHCSTEKRQNPHKVQRPGIFAAGALWRKKKDEAQIQASALTSFLMLRAAR